MDEAYLTQSLWNDGAAEVAFYEVNRTRNQYGRQTNQTFRVGTYLVKHRFSPESMSKATDGGGTSAFKYALFYEFESGSYQYKRNWVINVRQSDLAPLKQSFTSFDWCSNLYREMAFQPGGTVDALTRSDDYGNETRSFDAPDTVIPPAGIPLLVRSLRGTETQSFGVVLPDGDVVGATATLEGSETVSTTAGEVDAERIAVTYDAPVPSMVGEETGTSETYWRMASGDRRLVKLSGDDGRYEMTLIEHLRTPYWKENLWTRVERVQERP